MKVGLTFNKAILFVCCTMFGFQLQAQFLVDMIDTTNAREKGIWAIYNKTDHLQISGYFQPQFQIAQSKGVENFSGGDFPKYSNNRFMIRRGRIRFDYAHYNADGLPQAQVVFQFDGSERGVVIRDFWARYFENKMQLFSFTAGMFARPFGYELNLSSSDRESIERGRMSQELMKTERDLGVMATFEPRKKTNPLQLFKLDAGFYNGQGLAASEDFDSYKDFISRLSIKPYKLSKAVSLTAGVSFFQGGLVQNTRYIYRMDGSAGDKSFTVDSSAANIGTKLPRKYRGVDAQVKIKNGWGKTEFRAEYWQGTQTAAANQSITPAILQTDPLYVRKFNGVFLYILQNIFSPKHLLVLKYDIYDPNIKVSGAEVGGAGSNTHSGDVRYNTFGLGYNYYADAHIRLLFWYDMIKNESTSVAGYTSDIKDNIFTFRAQYRF